jgi:hypothetical protein
MSASDYVDTHIVAKQLGLCHRHIRRMCAMRVFKTAWKPGIGKHAHWKILRAELIEHQINNHAQPYL